MIIRELIIQNKLGIHARPASLLVQMANKFDAEITIVKQGKEINAKSILGVMMLAAECGSTIKFVVKGVDEMVAISELESLVNNKFNED
ncbi:MAG: HPr family phosphocarrier protein [bacterium]|nr:HPr family phosphocarrier protein [bacterium]